MQREFERMNFQYFLVELNFLESFKETKMNEFATIKCCLSDQREKRFSESVVTQAARTRRSFTASAKWVRSAVLVIRGGRGQEQILTLLSLFALFCNVSVNNFPVFTRCC